MISASIIICTHNPRQCYLHRVLEALRDQTLPVSDWELLLIDNASDEPLTRESWDISWHPHARFIREEELGLTSARLRGMREGRTDLFIFVDDDNVLYPTYLSEALRIKREWPELGVWGSGSTVPEFEVEPAESVREFLYMLALRDVDSPKWSNVIPCVGARPWGAGQCVRSSVAIAYRDHLEHSLIRIDDRKGGKLSSGGDVEMSFVACKLGFGVGIFPELRVIHLIPKERLSEDYLVALAEGIGISGHLLAFEWEKIRPASPFSTPLDCLRVLKHLTLRRGIQRRMYLAGVRSRLRAHSIIEANHNGPRCPIQQAESVATN